MAALGWYLWLWLVPLLVAILVLAVVLGLLARQKTRSRSLTVLLAALLASVLVPIGPSGLFDIFQNAVWVLVFGMPDNLRRVAAACQSVTGSTAENVQRNCDQAKAWFAGGGLNDLIVQTFGNINASHGIALLVVWVVVTVVILVGLSWLQHRPDPHPVPTKVTAILAGLLLLGIVLSASGTTAAGQLVKLTAETLPDTASAENFNKTADQLASKAPTMPDLSARIPVPVTAGNSTDSSSKLLVSLVELEPSRQRGWAAYATLRGQIERWTGAMRREAKESYAFTASRAGGREQVTYYTNLLSWLEQNISVWEQTAATCFAELQFGEDLAKELARSPVPEVTATRATEAYMAGVRCAQSAPMSSARPARPYVGSMTDAHWASALAAPFVRMEEPRAALAAAAVGGGLIGSVLALQVRRRRRELAMAEISQGALMGALAALATWILAEVNVLTITVRGDPRPAAVFVFAVIAGYMYQSFWKWVGHAWSKFFADEKVVDENHSSKSNGVRMQDHRPVNYTETA